MKKMTDQKPFPFDQDHPADPTFDKRFSDDPTPAFKLHRKDGPDTSQEAAEHLNVSGMELEVLNVIAEYDNGVISDTVVHRFGAERYATVTARYKALMEKGLIEDTGERRTGMSGRKQRVMRATKKGKQRGK